MKTRTRNLNTPRRLAFFAIACVIAGFGVAATAMSTDTTVAFSRKAGPEPSVAYSANSANIDTVASQVVDNAAYDAKMRMLANYNTDSTSTLVTTCSMTEVRKTNKLHKTTHKQTCTHVVRPVVHHWPAKAPYPNAGAILPFHRIVAYYGNFYSKGMGVLGKYPPDEMLVRLKAAAKQWQDADPATPVIPAIHYIAVTAQGTPEDGTYRLRMPEDQIQKAINLANQVHGLVFLDVQVGLSTLHKELPLLVPYLKNPIVHLAIDPEFSMKDGVQPGKEIGTFNAGDVNYAVGLLSDIVRANNLTPKILIVHRFTQDMVTGSKDIKPLPEVQIVMDMDGWGSQAKKIGTYTNIVAAEPLQFTGFKLFYKNDLLPPSTGMLTPRQILSLQPQPIYIQYQ